MKKSELKKMISEEIKSLLNEQVEDDPGFLFFKKYGKNAERLSLKNREKFISAAEQAGVDVANLYPYRTPIWSQFINPKAKNPKEPDKKMYFEIKGGKLFSLFEEYHSTYYSVRYYAGQYNLTEDDILKIDPTLIPEEIYMVYNSDYDGRRVGEYLAAVNARSDRDALNKANVKFGAADRIRKSQYNNIIKSLEAEIKEKQDSLNKIKKIIK